MFAVFTQTERPTTVLKLLSSILAEGCSSGRVLLSNCSWFKASMDRAIFDPKHHVEIGQTAANLQHQPTIWSPLIDIISTAVVPDGDDRANKCEILTFFPIKHCKSMMQLTFYCLSTLQPPCKYSTAISERAVASSALTVANKAWSELTSRPRYQLWKSMTHCPTAAAFDDCRL